MLYEVERMSMAEVAATLGCPLQTAYSRLHKARERVVAMVGRARLREEVP
jgi:RNA polymerase sigma-70 factor (ECF subfamily)